MAGQPQPVRGQQEVVGGKLKLEDLTPRLITRYLAEGVPIITGLSSTFLYRTAREMSPSNAPDDVRGEPQGHFVMLVGYDSERREVLIADPLDQNPPFYTSKYRLDIDRLVNAILLGVFTHDANLLIITPRARGRTAGESTAPPPVDGPGEPAPARTGGKPGSGKRRAKAASRRAEASSRAGGGVPYPPRVARHAACGSRRRESAPCRSCWCWIIRRIGP